MPEAVGRANATAGLSVLFAGITVVVAIASLQVAGIPMLTTMGWGSAHDGGGHDDRRRHPAPRAARAGRAQGEQPAGAVRAAEAGQRRSTPGPVGGPPGSSPDRSATAWSRRCCSASSPRRRSRCGSASPTTATRRPPARCASPTTCVADGFGPGFNGPLQVAVEVDGAGRHGSAARHQGRCWPTTEASPRSSRPAISPARRPGGHRGHPDHVAAGRGHDRAGAPAARRGPARRDARARRRDHAHRRARRSRWTSPPGCRGRCCCSSAP